MKVVIDTNILVSAALKDRVPEEVILYTAAQPDIEWIVSSQILQEYKEVLGRKRFDLPKDIIHTWFALLDSLTVLIDVDLTIDFPRDQKDATFLACAIVSDADYFITGDRNFSQAQKLLKTTILSASQFKKLVMNK